jgi:hypothetical protein
MRTINALLACAGVMGLTAGPVLAQATAPAAPPSRVAPSAPDIDADDPTPDPTPVLPRAAPEVSPAPGWTFEEVMGGEVTVGEPVSPTAMAIGALAGVAAFNVLGQYLFPNTSLLSQTFLAESDIAASRLYAVGSAVAGALAGQYVYERTNDRP